MMRWLPTIPPTGRPTKDWRRLHCSLPGPLEASIWAVRSTGRSAWRGEFLDITAVTDHIGGDDRFVRDAFSTRRCCSIVMHVVCGHADASDSRPLRTPGPDNPDRVKQIR